VAAESTTKIEVRILDYASFKSVPDFVKGLGNEEIDVAVLNAGELI
jgi:hypothetical protein